MGPIFPHHERMEREIGRRQQMSVTLRRRAGPALPSGRPHTSGGRPQLGGHGTGIWAGAEQASGGSRAQAQGGPTKRKTLCRKESYMHQNTCATHEAAAAHDMMPAEQELHCTCGHTQPPSRPSGPCTIKCGVHQDVTSMLS